MCTSAEAEALMAKHRNIFRRPGGIIEVSKQYSMAMSARLHWLRQGGEEAAPTEEIVLAPQPVKNQKAPTLLRSLVLALEKHLFGDTIGVWCRDILPSQVFFVIVGVFFHPRLLSVWAVSEELLRHLYDFV